jgi:hypothetical protein
MILKDFNLFKGMIFAVAKDFFFRYNCQPVIKYWKNYLRGMIT